MGGLLACWTPASPTQAVEAPEASLRSVPRGLDDLRGVYLQQGDTGSGDARVGRLTLQHLVGGVAREVSRHHRFRSGDRFRFLISANRAGWLYVQHRSDEGPASVLWPPPPGSAGDPGPGANRLLPRLPAQVPPPPAVFVFDQDVGIEHFYVTIVPEPQPPSLRVITKAPVRPAAVLKTQPYAPAKPRPQMAVAADLPPQSGPRIVQFSVRSIDGGMGSPSRGVVLDPNPKDADPATYFTSLPEDSGETLVFEFQLYHEG